MIRISSKRHLFRRCGMAHPKDPVEYPDDRFTKKELKVLKAEPMLTVVVEKSGSTKSVPSARDAARQAIADGNVTSTGKPTTEAMSKILGAPVSAEARDMLWADIQKEDNE